MLAGERRLVENAPAPAPRGRRADFPLRRKVRAFRGSTRPHLAVVPKASRVPMQPSPFCLAGIWRKTVKKRAVLSPTGTAAVRCRQSLSRGLCHWHNTVSEQTHPLNSRKSCRSVGASTRPRPRPEIARLILGNEAEGRSFQVASPQKGKAACIRAPPRYDGACWLSAPLPSIKGCHR
jgi:hypothetical protein